MGAGTNRDNFFDTVIVGGGPAGLTAALYLARACYRVLVIEKETFGGQITITSEVVNYPGIASIDGKALTENMRVQAQNFGAEFLLAEVTSLDLDGDIKTVHTSRGNYTCFGVLIATGAHPRTVGFQGELDWRGHGVAYCATCDGEFFIGKEVFVIGGGFAAAEESVFLTKYASHVTILIRSEDFKCAKSTADAARSHPKITVLTNTSVDYVDGEQALTSIQYRNSKTGEVTLYKAKENDSFGVFVFAGYTPATELIKTQIDLNPQGYVLTDPNQKTNLDGVYAAGDVCVKNLRQVVTAVGDGATAATELEKYAHEMAEKTGKRPVRPEAQPKKPAGKNKAAASAPKAAAASGNSPFSEAINAQLDTVFSRMSGSLVLKLYLDEKPVSAELKQYMDAMAARTDKLTVEIAQNPSADTPCVRLFRPDGTDTGLAFHGVPCGHEFTSFVLGLYNAAGPGQPIDAASLAQIKALDKTTDMKILVSLSCTMCPELVTAAQRIAAENPNVRAEVYDLNHFPALKDKYHVMSVPCLVVNDGEKVTFGKKNIGQLLQIL